jgi:hypothetical protein
MMAKGQRTLADRRPDAASDRLQAEAVFVRPPILDRLVRMTLSAF